jgi:biotin-dependent carboxylase-like uncharacterized protein
MTDDIELLIGESGWITTIQDLGRRDAERLGVPTGGAADQRSAAVANILVGNRRTAPLIETIGARFAFTPARDILIAVTGTPAALTVDGEQAELWHPVPVAAGMEVSLTEPRFGARSYVAVSGAIQTETFLGSAAPDARMGFGQALGRSSALTLRSSYTGLRQSYFDRSLFNLPVPRFDLDRRAWTIDVVETAELNGIPGLRTLLASSKYVVTDRSNHVGLRLNGPVLHPESTDVVVSHGVPVGAVEIPHSDELIVLGRYRTLTAGYPIVGVATQRSLALLGQSAPGRELVFRWVDREEARREVFAFEGALRDLEERVLRVFTALGLPIAADLITLKRRTPCQL